MSGNAKRPRKGRPRLPALAIPLPISQMLGADALRQRIQAAALIDALQDSVLLGHADPSVLLEASQVRAAQALIDKCLPSLTSTSLDGAITVRTLEDEFKQMPPIPGVAAGERSN